jgi:urease alpha subunit
MKLAAFILQVDNYHQQGVGGGRNADCGKVFNSSKTLPGKFNPT